MTTDSAQIISHAAKRKSEMDLQYAGALLPTEAAALLAADSNAKLVDVRTTPELVYVGRVPNQPRHNRQQTYHPIPAAAKQRGGWNKQKH